MSFNPLGNKETTVCNVLSCKPRWSLLLGLPIELTLPVDVVASANCHTVLTDWASRGKYFANLPPLREDTCWAQVIILPLKINL